MTWDRAWLAWKCPTFRRVLTLLVTGCSLCPRGLQWRILQQVKDTAMNISNMPCHDRWRMFPWFCHLDWPTNQKAIYVLQTSAQNFHICRSYLKIVGIRWMTLNMFRLQNLQTTIENIADGASRPELMQPCCRISVVVKQSLLTFTTVRCVQEPVAQSV